MNIPDQHKELAKHLRERFGGPATVFNYRDDDGRRPVAVGGFGPLENRFYSTIGVCDKRLKVPAGRFEFAAMGGAAWLPNALASSFYWLRERVISEWPMICEDVVMQNERSRWRHMAYVPSIYSYAVVGREPVRWLLGIPIRDSQLSLKLSELRREVSEVYPAWMTVGLAQPARRANGHSALC